MEQGDKRIEELVNKLMAADSLEKAPLEFTDNVMAKVEALQKSTVTVYKPLIPKYVWWLIGSGFIALVGYIIFNQPKSTTSLSDRYNIPEVSFNLLKDVSFDFSNTLLYAMVLLAIMVSVQIPLLKQYFNNRMAF
ncbi:hypothetical protein [Winogradskyella sp. A2]|uniref:hypothetical protein n=1 Tax=Winogradskyella sp. A2 TaxID=3366944 RepID=UPI00398C7D81